MPMLDAIDPAFRERYSNGCIIRDRLGRQLLNVVACNPETGEVITYSVLPIVAWWIRARWRISGSPRSWQVMLPASMHDAFLLRRHGFWPAPLTIEPRQWLHIGMS